MRLTTCLLLAGLAGCAHSPVDDPLDPLEPINRKVFVFNSAVDRAVLRPAAKAYVAVTPAPARKGIYNFLGNLFYPTVIMNDFLQAKLRQGVEDTGRFLINSTFGVLGLFDVADDFFGLQRHSEDFGLTLAHWGVGEGWFLMVPILGPATNRDLVGRFADSAVDPFYKNVSNNEVRWTVVGLSVLSGRSRYLGADNLLDEVFDPYSFVRGAYLQRRSLGLNQNQPLPDPRVLQAPD